ncbi:MAG: DUF2079 domain-containing protein [Candidatus Levybacteria bacterium]|nr:DUF2079 domain-containing protein [Candidatus Levybacteria bacterium]
MIARKHEVILFLLFLTYCLYFVITSFFRFDNFHTGRFDLGNMDQAVWNTINGRIFESSNSNGIIASRFASHADFLLILLSPFYLIWSHPKMLLLIQTLVVGAGAFFVYAIGKNILKNKNISLVLAFTYLLNPAIQRANLYDFHAVTLATSFLLGTYYFYLKKKYKLFTLFALLSALSKEQIWLIIALFGVLLFVQQKKRIFGIIVLLVSVSIFYFLIWYGIPNALGSQHFALSYYSDFGDSPTQVVLNILFSPQKVLDIVLQQGRISYLVQLFFPHGFLSLLSPFYLIFALPDLLINLLSSKSLLRELYYHYTATISPFIFIATIQTIALIRKKTTRVSSGFFIFYLLIASFVASYLYGPLPGSIRQDVEMYTKRIPNQEFIRRYLANIPEKYSIASTNNVGSHISERRRVFVLPSGIDKADIVIFLRIRSEEKLLVQKIKKDLSYDLAVEKGEFLVFKKKEIK